MKKIIVLFVVLCCSIMIFGAKVATIKEVFKPDSIAIDDRNIYISEKTSVFIYSLKDYKFKSKFGKPGEGPQEFKNTPFGLALQIIPQKDYLFIISTNKFSFFTKEGNFIKEIKTTSIANTAFPIGSNFVKIDFTMDQKSQTVTITWLLVDKDMKKIKALSEPRTIPFAQGVLPDNSPQCRTYKNFIVTQLQSDDTITLLILDEKGNKIASINQKADKAKVTQGYMDNYYNFFGQSAQFKPYLEEIKKRTKFKTYFPPLCPPLMLDDNSINFFTYKVQNGKQEFYSFNYKGQLLKHTFLPISNIADSFLPPLIVVKNNKIYQLIENEETEELELHAFDIK